MSLISWRKQHAGLLYRITCLFITFHNLRVRKREKKWKEEKKKRKKTWNRNHLQILRILGCGQPFAVLCLVTQSYPTLCDPMDCSSPGSSVHGDFPGKNTGWVVMPSCRWSSLLRERTQVSHIAGGILYHLSHQGSPWTVLDDHYVAYNTLFFNFIFKPETLY